MFEKLGKIEEIINTLLTKVWNVFFQFFIKLIPTKFLLKFKDIKKNFDLKKERFKKRIYVGLNKTRKFIKSLFNFIFSKADQLQKIPVKEKTISIVKELIHYLKTATIQDHKKNVKDFFAPIFHFLQRNYAKIDWKDVRVIAIVSTIFLFGGVVTYFSAQNIYNQQFPSRKIASVQEYDYNPDYKLYERKTIVIQNVKLPIFVESVNKISSITLDFSIRTSTRFARHFLEQYEYKLKDYFFTMVEPVVSDFPLETEGKEVLKETIQLEIENFLYDHKVEGVIEEVNILYIVGS